MNAMNTTHIDTPKLPELISPNHRLQRGCQKEYRGTAIAPDIKHDPSQSSENPARMYREATPA